MYSSKFLNTLTEEEKQFALQTFVSSKSFRMTFAEFLEPKTFVPTSKESVSSGDWNFNVPYSLGYAEAMKDVVRALKQEKKSHYA